MTSATVDTRLVDKKHRMRTVLVPFVAAFTLAAAGCKKKQQEGQPAAKTLKSVQGGELPIDLSSGTKIGGATVVTADVAASNGVIHVIDTVLALPK